MLCFPLFLLLVTANLSSFVFNNLSCLHVYLSVNATRHADNNTCCRVACFYFLSFCFCLFFFLIFVAQAHDLDAWLVLDIPGYERQVGYVEHRTRILEESSSVSLYTSNLATGQNQPYLCHFSQLPRCFTPTALTFLLSSSIISSSLLICFVPSWCFCHTKAMSQLLSITPTTTQFLSLLASLSTSFLFLS